jgi:hypothetical protein
MRVPPLLSSSVELFENASSGIVLRMIREIEISYVPVLMVNRYADEAKANSFRRAEELRPKCESRRSAPKLASMEGDHASGKNLTFGAPRKLPLKPAETLAS